jgi:CRP/FNR family transcriptional regulator
MAHAQPGSIERGAGREFDVEWLAQVVTPRPFLKGTEIAVQDQPCRGLHLIRRGQILLSRRNVDGENYALYLLGAGEMFGEGSLRPEGRWLATARAVTDGSLFVLPASQLPGLLQAHSQLASQLLVLMSGRLEQAHRRLDLLSTTSARERVLGLLRVMAGTRGRVQDGELWLSLPLTHGELGGMLGMTRETVARVVSALEAEGLIRHRRRHGFWITAAASAGLPGVGAIATATADLSGAARVLSGLLP